MDQMAANGMYFGNFRRVDFNPNVTVPKVVDVNNEVVPATAVNYANVYLYGTLGDDKQNLDGMAKKVIDPVNPPSQPWNASARHWRIDVLTYLNSGASAKVSTDYSGRTRVTEMNFSKADGVYGNVTLEGIAVNGIVHSNNNTLHDNTYNPDNSQRFNGNHINAGPAVFDFDFHFRLKRWRHST